MNPHTTSSEMPEMLHPVSWANPQVLEKKIFTRKTQLKIGVPKEQSLQENRVSLIPEAVGVLVLNGHTVLIEHNAGAAAQFSDRAYTEVGAQIVYESAEIYKECDVIVKITPLSSDELQMMQDGKTLLSAVHLGSIKPDYLKTLTQKNITAIGFEFIRNSEFEFPMLQMMSEIAGASSILIASELLTVNNGGKGLLLGGITGVPPAVVTVLGAGNAGVHAAITALGLGADVKVIDEDIAKLRRLEYILGRKVYTAVSQQNYIEEAVISADVVIGAIFKSSGRTPVIVTEEMVTRMREGSVIVDISIDQGGCFETSEVTTHSKPTYIRHGVIHYCVPNIASRVPNTASSAISNILAPMLVQLGNGGTLNDWLGVDRYIKSGIYAYRRHITHKALAGMFGLDYMDIDLLYAAHF
jgi:alanine dehydrogenase